MVHLFLIIAFLNYLNLYAPANTLENNLIEMAICHLHGVFLHLPPWEELVHTYV